MVQAEGPVLNGCPSEKVTGFLVTAHFTDSIAMLSGNCWDLTYAVHT